LGKFAKYLPQFGWEPFVLTVDEVKGYSQDLPVEIDEVDICRTSYFALGPTISYELTSSQRTIYQTPPRSSTWRKVLYKLIHLTEPVYNLPVIRTLTLEPVGWYRHALKKGLEIAGKEKFNVIFSSYGPSMCHLVASKLHRQTGIPWVAEFRDLWSLNANVRKIQPFHFFERKLEKRVMKDSSLLITVSEPLAKRLEALHSKKVVVIPNGFDEEDYLEKVPLTTKFTITYTGNIYTGKQNPSPLFKAIAELEAEGKISPEDFQVRFFGGGTLTSLLPAIRYYHLEKVVKICGLVPFEESIRKQKESTVLLFLGWTDRGEKGFYTAKVFEYLGARRPILAIGLKGDVVDELLKETGAGVMVSEVNEIKALLSEWMQESKQSGQILSHFKSDSTAVYRYTRKQQADKLAQLLEEVSGHQE
jgi:glycosyltransferase involved in cell wall biosynthesis